MKSQSFQIKLFQPLFSKAGKNVVFSSSFARDKISAVTHFELRIEKNYIFGQEMIRVRNSFFNVTDSTVK